jgi:hypothetical protein
VTARRSLLFLGALAAAAVIAIAMSSGLRDDQVETGVVVAVDSAGLTDVRGFSLRTADGRTIEFRIGRLQNPVQFPPAHLGVHLADGVPVRVTFEVVGDERVAIRLEDAPR